MIAHEKKAANFDKELDDMHNTCEDLYNRYIMQPRIPFLIKVQKHWRNIQNRKNFIITVRNSVKLIRLFKAMSNAHERTLKSEFFHRVCNRMAKLNDYRMCNREGKELRKAKWLRRREFQRAECKMLTLYFFGGLMNKFHTKWKRSSLTNLIAHK